MLEILIEQVVHKVCQRAQYNRDKGIVLELCDYHLILTKTPCIDTVCSVD
jgi:hypothetical protein